MRGSYLCRVIKQQTTMQAKRIKALIQSGQAKQVLIGKSVFYKIGSNTYDANGHWVDGEFNTEDKVPAGDE